MPIREHGTGYGNLGGRGSCRCLSERVRRHPFSRGGDCLVLGAINELRLGQRSACFSPGLSFPVELVGVAGRAGRRWRLRGFQRLRATRLRCKHVNALVAEWQRRRLAAGTMNPSCPVRKISCTNTLRDNRTVRLPLPFARGVDALAPGRVELGRSLTHSGTGANQHHRHPRRIVERRARRVALTQPSPRRGAKLLGIVGTDVPQHPECEIVRQARSEVPTTKPHPAPSPRRIPLSASRDGQPRRSRTTAH